jgi:acyl-CoA reductase-like NAD-dependent aldehyde dehydrogenase
MAHSFEVVSPVDGSVQARITEANPSQIARVLDESQTAFRLWRKSPIDERIALVESAVQELERRKEEIAQTLTMCMGRPAKWAKSEIDGTADRARTMSALAERALADLHPPAVEGFTRFIRREPLGSVLVLSPWNYPYLTAVNAIVPALLSGNTVILKHSDQTPLAAEHFRAAFESAGVPKGVFQILHMNHEATAQVLVDDCIDHVCFTGSVEGGAAVTAALASRRGRKRFIGSGLELGGNDPAYVRADADIEHAAANVVEGALFNSGQSCCGIERIYVHASIADRFIEAAIEAAKGWTLGDPREASVDLGPVARQRNADSIRAQLTAALESGARPLLDTAAWSMDRADTPYIAPQLLTNVNHDMPVMSEETFGPCAGIMTVDTDEEAVALMNDSAYGLTASLWTRDPEAAMGLATEIESGTVFLNRCDYLDPALAWTGVKNSGRGTTLSTVGFECLTRSKSFHFRTELPS